MKKLLLLALLFLPALCIAGTTSYFNLTHYGYIPSTPTATGDYYYRGGFHVGYDTSTLSVSGINTQFDVWQSSVVISISTFIKVDGVNVDFSIDASSATFYDALNVNGQAYFGGDVNLDGLDGIYWTDDANTYIYRAAADLIDIVVGAIVPALRISDVTTYGGAGLVTVGGGPSSDVDLKAWGGIIADKYIQFKSSTTVGLQGTTPAELGQTYWNTDTNELWISTGTAVNQFIHK